MTAPRLNLAFVLAALALVVVVIRTDPYRLVDLGGHGKLIGYGIWALLIGLCLTHIALAGIMWVQRTRWRPSEAGMFRFMAVKAIFWGSFAWAYRPHPEGEKLINIVLFVLMVAVTAHADVLLFRRYILGAESGVQPGAVAGEDVVTYNGPERRGIWPGRRYGDTR